MANIPISSFTAAANATGIGMSGFSLTGSNAQSMLDLTGTWNTSGTPTAIDLNVTDTASNAASLLMNLRVGGSSIASVRKNGIALFGPTAAFVNGIGVGTPAVNVGDGASVATTFAGGQLNVWSSNINVASLNSGGVALRSTSSVSWGSGASVSGADLTLFRDAANTLAQRSGTNAQTFRVYNTFTDASNYERAEVHWVGNVFRVGTYAAGTGTGRTLTFLTSGVERWSINASTGHLLAVTDNTYDIGASGATRPRNIFAAGDIYTLSNTSGFFLGSAADVSLLRDDANILAQRRSTNAQTFRIYNTSTDASNYERGFVRWNANAFQIGSESAGTGVARGVVLSSADHLDLQSAAARSVRIAPAGTTTWLFNSSGHLIAGADNTSDIGAGGGNRPRNLYMASWIRMATTTVASLPAAATAGAGARMFVTDASGPVFGSAVAGGGAVTVPVYSTGSAWNVG